MDSATASPSDDQLIAQTRRLSLDSPSASASPLSPPQAASARRSPGGNPGCDSGAGVHAAADSPAAVATTTTTTTTTATAADVAAGAQWFATAAGDEQLSSSSNNNINGSLAFSPLLPADRRRGPGASSMCLEHLPNEVLFHIFGFLDVNDLLSTSRASHQLRSVSLSPLLHAYRLRRVRDQLPPLLSSRPNMADLITRHIFLTKTSVVSRRLARSLVSIRLSRRLAARPPAEALVERAVLPKECVPGMVPVHVAPSIVQRRRAVEKERIKDGLRRWIEGKWSGEVREREQSQKKWEESRGVGRVWRLRRFWERIGKGEEQLAVG